MIWYYAEKNRGMEEFILLKSGLTSVTFRNLKPLEIIRLSNKSGLNGIEWGGDVHVPPKDVKLAKQVERMTTEEGLEVSSYGSYFRLVKNETNDFLNVVETAIVLKAPIIRVWAGSMGSKEADPAYRQKLVEQSYKIAEIADDAGIMVAFEFHNNTLADTSEAVLGLLKDIAHHNMKTYWQPHTHASTSTNLKELKAVLQNLTNVHAFYFSDDKNKGLLQEGLDDWRQYIQAVSTTDKDHWVLLEFVKDNSEESFFKDAETLKELLAEYN